MILGPGLWPQDLLAPKPCKFNLLCFLDRSKHDEPEREVRYSLEEPHKGEWKRSVGKESVTKVVLVHNKCAFYREKVLVPLHLSLQKYPLMSSQNLIKPP